MATIITLTTDFGLNDAYIAAMKGVILSINPEAKLVDICHTIKPQNVLQGAFIFSTACHFFPKKTVHVVVVDPGVGTERRAIILRTPVADFVGPDNGVLSYVIEQYGVKAKASQVRLRQEAEAVALTNSRFWHLPVSSTFHGRDIFAPVAAWLSLGIPLAEFGEKITSVTMLPLPRSYPDKDGSLVGQILHIDSFGNLITNIRNEEVNPKITVEVRKHVIKGLSRTYAEGEGLLAIVGSSGYLEIALKEGNAGAFLGARVGDKIRVRFQQEAANELPGLRKRS